MAKKLKKGIHKLVEEARADIDEVDPQEALRLQASGEAVIVDIRDVRERAREGFIKDSFHCPRGMAEFWVDPDSPYFKPIFGEDKRFLLHCAVDWRSALTVHTLKQMGMDNVAHIRGGRRP